MFDSISPTSGQVLASFAEISPADLNDKLDAAVRAQRAWAKSPITARSELLRRIAGVLRGDVPQWANLISLEMGKPIAESEAEILKCAWCCDFYADNAERFLEPEMAPSAATESYIVLDPLGVVLAIMPWNFPFWQFFRFAAPAIAAGNGMVLKHASNVPQCAGHR